MVIRNRKQYSSSRGTVCVSEDQAVSGHASAVEEAISDMRFSAGFHVSPADNRTKQPDAVESDKKLGSELVHACWGRQRHTVSRNFGHWIARWKVWGPKEGSRKIVLSLVKLQGIKIWSRCGGYRAWPTNFLGNLPVPYCCACLPDLCSGDLLQHYG
jgi:hypothetical protein